MHRKQFDPCGIDARWRAIIEYIKEETIVEIKNLYPEELEGMVNTIQL